MANKDMSAKAIVERRDASLHRLAKAVRRSSRLLDAVMAAENEVKVAKKEATTALMDAHIRGLLGIEMWMIPMLLENN